MEPRPRASLVTLPTETLWQICEEIRGEVSNNRTIAENRQPGSRDLFNLSRCHSRLCSAVQPILYRDICFDRRSMSRVGLLHRTLVESRVDLFLLIRSLQLECKPRDFLLSSMEFDLQFLIALVMHPFLKISRFRLQNPCWVKNLNQVELDLNSVGGLPGILASFSRLSGRLKEVVLDEGDLNLKSLESFTEVESLHLVHSPRHPHYDYRIPENWKWTRRGLKSLSVTFPGNHLQDRARELFSLVSRFQGLQEFRIQGGPDHQVMVSDLSYRPYEKQVLRSGRNVLLALHAASPRVQRVHLGSFAAIGPPVINLRIPPYRAPQMQMKSNVSWMSKTETRRPLDILPMFSALRELSISAHYLQHVKSNDYPDPGSEENNPLIILARDCPSLSSLSILDIELFNSPRNEPGSFLNILLKFARALGESKGHSKKSTGEKRFPNLKTFEISTLAAGGTRLMSCRNWPSSPEQQMKLPVAANHPATVGCGVPRWTPGLKEIRRKQDRLLDSLTAENEPFTALFEAAGVTYRPRLRRSTLAEFHEFILSRPVMFIPGDLPASRSARILDDIFEEERRILTTRRLGDFPNPFERDDEDHVRDLLELLYSLGPDDEEHIRHLLGRIAREVANIFYPPRLR